MRKVWDGCLSKIFPLISNCPAYISCWTWNEKSAMPARGDSSAVQFGLRESWRSYYNWHTCKIFIFVYRYLQINKVTPIYPSCFEVLQRRRLPLSLYTCSTFDCSAAVYVRAVSYKPSLSIQKETTQFCNGVQNPVFKKHLSIYTVSFFWQFPVTIVL